MPEHMINKLAEGLFAEWKSEKWVNRRGMIRQAYNMEGGPDRLAAMKFLRMVEDAERRGTV
jgi:hypothetical protein